MQKSFEARTVVLALTLLSTGLGVASQGSAAGESGTAPTSQTGPSVVTDTREAAAKAFAAALAKNTVAAFEAFLAAHPDSREAAEARDRIGWLREDADYTKARAADEEEEYRAFLRNHPGAVFREEVELRIKAIVDRKAQEQARQRAAAEAAGRRAGLFAEAARLDTAAAYRLFLAAYPEGPEAKEAERKLKDAEADDAAFAEAQTSEQGLRAYLSARPEGRHAGEARGRIEARKGAPAAAPVAPTPSAAAFAAAREKRTVPALEEFLAAYPDSAEGAEARERLEWLREDAAYESARSADTEEGYRAFVRDHPNAVLRDEVELRLKAIVDRNSREQAAQQAGAEAERRRKEAYASATRLDTAAGYAFFAAAYPDAPEASDVQRRLEAVRADDAAYAGAQGSEEGLKGYLAARPNGAHAKQAREGLLALKNAASEGAFKEAARLDTAAALESFLKAYPDSPRALEARAALEKRRKVPEPSVPSPAASTLPALVASFTASPPVSNGRADDRAWQGAQGVELPLAGGRGPRSIRLKAAHDGKSVYVLAQWSDPTGDTASRPWVWSAARRTYVQDDGRFDDGLLVLLYRGKNAAEPLALEPQGLEADAWLWRANTSEVSGLAEDGWLQMGAERFPKARVYPSPAGGRMWARSEPDAGAPAWNFYMPSGQQGPQVSSFRRAKAAGSRADVSAGGKWSSGVWTVEFARALDTRHTDDVALRVGGSSSLAFGIFDRAEEAPQGMSGVVRLELRGR